MPTPEPHETLTTGRSMAPPAGPIRPPAQGRGTRAGASPVLTGRPYIGYGGTMSDKLTRMRSGAGLDQSLTDWDRLDALTDDEIAAAIRHDPDAFEPEPGYLEKCPSRSRRPTQAAAHAPPGYRPGRLVQGPGPRVPDPHQRRAPRLCRARAQTDGVKQRALFANSS
jgi:hypothetical protein